jgi:hypothetical protein
MSWQRRLKEIALAGGLAGGCATNAATSGSTASTGAGGSGYVGPPPCNANPDPCCLCSLSGQGYGGASCVANNFTQVDNTKITCQDELNCIAAPTAQCCQAPLLFNCDGQNACRDAGFLDSGCP